MLFCVVVVVVNGPCRYEKEDDFVGGLSSSEIPGYRLPYEAVKWEVELAKDLGVKVQHGAMLGRDMTVKSLQVSDPLLNDFDPVFAHRLTSGFSGFVAGGRGGRGAGGHRAAGTDARRVFQRADAVGRVRMT